MRALEAQIAQFNQQIEQSIAVERNHHQPSQQEQPIQSVSVADDASSSSPLSWSSAIAFSSD
ncbi:MAG: hypothetical protein QNJ34_26315 [Xenococcaceae cyanobacterium MO_188.B29]|nr:hypothetical protein [Xenococcaceae cyanobacterium MO_188.B29]